MRNAVSLLIACGLAATACGGDSVNAPPRTGASSSQATTPARAPGSLRFAAKPDVVFYFAGRAGARSAWFHTTVRTNLPLPQGAHGIEAGIDVTDASQDIPGLERLGGTRRCYQQENFATGPREPRDGDVVTVRLTVGGRPGQVLRTQARARLVQYGAVHNDVRNARRVRALVRRLGCPRAPRARRCEVSVPARTLSAIVVQSAGGGATCAAARRVMLSVGTWTDEPECPTDLCVRQNRTNAGYRCTVAKVGEIDWTITCKRGDRVVRGYAGG